MTLWQLNLCPQQIALLTLYGTKGGNLTYIYPIGNDITKLSAYYTMITRNFLDNIPHSHIIKNFSGYRSVEKPQRRSHTKSCLQMLCIGRFHNSPRLGVPVSPRQLQTYTVSIGFSISDIIRLKHCIYL